MRSRDRSAGDDLLRWASENESGAWSSLRDAAAYVLSGREARERPSQLATSLSSLGHLDIDWSTRRWSVAPPRLALSPGMGLCAYLAGWRPSFLMQRYSDVTSGQVREDLDLYPFEIRQGNGPHAVFSKCASVDEVYHTAEKLTIPVVLDPSAQLARLVSVPDLHSLPRGAPPPFEDLERFNPPDFSWRPVDDRKNEGLYQFELHGQKHFRLHAEGDWWIVDRGVGQLKVLTGSDGLIAWHRGSADQTVGRALAVKHGLSLPDLAERAAVAACGLLPFSLRGERIYRNVRREVAECLADALGLTLGDSRPPIDLSVETGGR